MPDMLQNLERQTAIDIVMVIIYQIILCYDTYMHCIQHKLQGITTVYTTKDDEDQDRETLT